MLQGVEYGFLHTLIEKLQVFPAILENVANGIFEKLLGNAHVVLQVIERHFWLNHPEFGQMAWCVAVLGAEGGPKGINFGKIQGKYLGLHLAADRKICGSTKKVLLPIYVTVSGPGDILQIQRGDVEHLTGALAIGGGDDWGLDVDEVPLLKEAVYGVGEDVAHAEGRAEGVTADPEVGDLAQELKRVSFLLRSWNAISGSIIQNSARWRGVLLFSARKVGPKV